MHPSRRVVLVVYDDCELLDVAGPLDVFSAATELSPQSAPRYLTEIVAPTAGPVRTSSGLAIVASSIRGSRGPIDTLVVVGGRGTFAALRDERLLRFLRAAAKRARRVVSVCTGSFLLAAAGLLDGRRATTHWSVCASLAAGFPAVRVEPDPIFIKDGSIWTSAGVTAGMDLALALVEEDYGPTVALDIARWLVIFLKRPGGQAQFSAQLAGQAAGRGDLRDLQSWIADHLAEPLAVPALARRVGMSVRNFARAFRREVGVSPAAYVENVRVEAARNALASTRRSIAEIARDVGFGTIETMERAFRRTVKIAPRDYRARFQHASGASSG